jgi:hypothetical protein
MHGLRSGCAISLALVGAELLVIMQHVGWKTSATINESLLATAASNDAWWGWIGLQYIVNVMIYRDLLKHFEET